MGKSIGILYLCTGNYYLFWEKFHSSFEANFLPDVLKRYYVFTDKPENINLNHDERVKVYYIEPQPWPLITLMRFHVFCRFRNEFADNDYLMFANSNLVCRESVSSDEFLPDDNHELSVVLHPGYWNRKSRYCPYERDRASTAYVPYNVKGSYMMGALYCGHSDDFMRMSDVLSGRVNEDFSNRKIAIWHDESQYNRYLLENHNVKVLSPSYLYPEGWELPFEKKIEILDKSRVFAVNDFKDAGKKKHKSFFAHIASSKFFRSLYCMRDTLLFRHI